MSYYDLVIIGTGLAGYTLARDWRKLEPDASLLLISSDDGAYYSKPMLSNGLAKNKSAQDLAVQSAEAMAATLNADIRPHTVVEAVDAAAKQLTDADGNRFGYGQLVLATGAQQIRLPIPGEGADAVITVNDLADYAVFRERIQTIDRVAVMGPGLIGCEFANDLAAIGKSTVIIGPDRYPLERLMPEPAGLVLQSALSEIGVSWQLQTVVERIDRHDNGFTLQLANGEREHAGLVLSAVGLRPDTRLGELAGIASNTGIQVDRYLQSSDAAIFALGDCAEIEGLVLPYIMPIMLASRALAKTLTGLHTAVSYPGMPVVIKTPAHPVVVAPPAPDAAGEWQIETTPEGVLAKYVAIAEVAADADPASTEAATESLLGFVLTGSHVKEKTRLGKLLPPTLPALTPS